MMYHVTLFFYYIYRRIAWVLYVKRVSVVGREHIPKTGPFIVAVTHHRSSEDPWRVSHLFGFRRVIHWYTNWELLDVSTMHRACRKRLPPGLAYLGALAYVSVTKFSQTIPVDRDHGATPMNALAFEKTTAILANKGIVGIFPEGGWDRDPEETNPGFVVIAKRRKVPILLVTLETDRIRIRPLFKPGDPVLQQKSVLAARAIMTLV